MLSENNMIDYFHSFIAEIIFRPYGTLILIGSKFLIQYLVPMGPYCVPLIHISLEGPVPFDSCKS